MIKIKRALFHEVFTRIFEAYRQKWGIFYSYTAVVAGPQHRFRPKQVNVGSREHIYWLALVALSDKRTNSSVLYRNFARMFERHPELFHIGEYPTVEEMGDLFRRYQIALPRMEIGFFVERKRHLDKFFGGDPFLIYEGVGNIADLMERLRELGKRHGVKNMFPGAKGKIFSLLWMFLREFRQLEFSEVVPVDVWVQSIAVSTRGFHGIGTITSQRSEKSLRPLLNHAFANYREVEGAANATWILGRYGCRLCGGQDMRELCPIYDLCKGPFERPRHPVTGKHLGVVRLPVKYKSKALYVNT